MTNERVRVTVDLLQENMDRLWTASALLGEDMSTVINRAIAFYDAVHRLEEPEQIGWFTVKRYRLTWTDTDGKKRSVIRTR